MGCDIHFIFQKLTESGWEDIESLYKGDQHYALFGVLAGVRGYGPPIDSPRGLPDSFIITDYGHKPYDEHPTSDIRFLSPHERRRVDINKPLYVWMGDHSYSWYSGDELIDWCGKNKNNDLAYFFDEVERLIGIHGKIRFVFGFDN